MTISFHSLFLGDDVISFPSVTGGQAGECFIVLVTVRPEVRGGTVDGNLTNATDIGVEN